MWNWFYDFIDYIQRMTPEQYLVVAGVTIAVGFFCLRGFGSRSSY